MENGRADELIERYIEPHPDSGSKAEARLKHYYVSVWALAGYFAAGDFAIADIAAAYDLPCEAVEAAFEYYKRYKVILDDRVAANSF